MRVIPQRQKNRCLCTLIVLVLTLAMFGCDDAESTSSKTDTAIENDTSGGDVSSDVTADTNADNADVVDDTTLNDSSEGDTSSDTSDTSDTSDVPDVEILPDLVDPDLSEADFKVRGTVNQIYIWMAPAETEMEVIDSGGGVVVTGTTDYQGSLVLREMDAMEDLSVRVASDPSNIATQVNVLSVEGSAPSDALYTQTLEPGFGYITMRDGTQLSVFVSLPGPVEDGPYPTIVNYSGYSPSKPGAIVSDLVVGFCREFPVLCDAPDHPAGLIAGVMGYASVGVNMRGTGCSGGAYDYFETLQLLDGYDIIEIVAAQSWVKHNKVGMAGLSYPGISQLFVAKMNPPSLAAIAPMSVLADSFSSTLAPGGIYNDGFALAWVRNVLNRALPYGHGWIQDVVDDGDVVCEEHQFLHSQMVDVVEKALNNPYYTEETGAPFDPSAFVHKITVPVFLTGQWQDEQTGPHFAALFDKFTSSPMTRFIVTNGVHADGYTPQILMDWKIFFDFYVAKEVPSFNERARDLVPLFFIERFEAALKMPANRFEDYTDYATALEDYEAEPQLRVIWETGADDEYPAGAPSGRFETFYEAWPIPSTVATRWYFQTDGSLSTSLPGADDGASSFNHDPSAATRTTLPSGSINKNQPNWDYKPLNEGSAITFITAPLAKDVVMLGHGSVDLWMRSSATDADLEVHLTEVRDDGQEMLVQSGWLRASQRALRSDATELRPVKTHLEEDAANLIPNEWTQVRVEIMPFGHIFRAGSRVRLSVDTPGDSAAEWFFILLDQTADEVHTIGHSEMYPSSVLLPFIPNVTVETPHPDCGALRGQPCRDYVPVTNTATTTAP